MTNWTVISHSATLAPNREIDFIESGQVDGYPASELKAGDELLIDWPAGGGTSGVVIDTKDNFATITVGKQKYKIRKANDKDHVFPITSEMRVDPWFVVDVISDQSNSK